MGSYRAVFIYCDHEGCDHEYTEFAPTLSEVRMMARQDGWRCSLRPYKRGTPRHVELCPDHAPRNGRNVEPDA